jgi:hypothetical protein
MAVEKQSRFNKDMMKDPIGYKMLYPDKREVENRGTTQDAWEKGNKSMDDSVNILLNMRPSTLSDVQQLQEECLTHGSELYDIDSDEFLKPTLIYDTQDHTSPAVEGWLKEVNYL